MENSPPKKRPSKHFTVEDKEKVLNIFKTFQEVPGTPKTVNVEMTAHAAGTIIILFNDKILTFVL